MDTYNVPVRGGSLKEITHLRHFFENIVNNFTIQFFILFSETLIISQLNHGFRKITEK